MTDLHPWALDGPYFPASHGIRGFGLRQSQELFQSHPECFALVGGQRKTSQHCLSDSEVLQRAVEATKAY